MHRRMGTLRLRGAEGLICPKFYTSFFFFLLCPDFPHCFARIWEGSCPPPPPAPLPRTPMARCMLNHLGCAGGPLHSQQILNFGVSWGGGGGLSPQSPPTGSLLDEKMCRLCVNFTCRLSVNRT